MLTDLFFTLRPKTLIIAFAVIFLGQLLAYFDLSRANITTFDFTIVAACLSCCLCLQIAVNLANDYFDFKAHVDGPNRLGPKRALQSNLISPSQLKKIIFGFCLFAIFSGGYLVYRGGWIFALLGILSLLGVYAYSGGKKSIASTGLGEVAVFFYFGWIAVIGSYYLQTGSFFWNLFIPASEIGCLIAAVMLVNNIRDITSDFAAGKVTLACRLGPSNSRWLYAVLLLLPFILLPFNPYLPWLNSVLLPLHLSLSWLIRKRTGRELNTQLGQTSLLVLLWALGYFFSFILSPF